MKIETSFRDLKSILNLEKIMNKSPFYLKQLIALILIAYAIALLVGEAIRDFRYAGVQPEEIDLLTDPETIQDMCWYLFSGIFLLLRSRRCLSFATLRKSFPKFFRSFEP
jgi:hypothetical protein